MKSRFFTIGIGTVVTAIALSQAMAAHQDATKPDASRVQPATAGQQVTDLEGKIMTLHAYLSGASSWGTDNAGGAATAPAKSSQQPQRDRNQNTNTGDEQSRTRANATATDKPGSAERSATTANPADATKTDAANPPWQGWAGTGAGTFSDQTLVFVAMRGTTVSSPSSTTSSSSTSTERNPNALPAISATAGSLATSAYGEAYVLLCNSSDPGSRSALSKAQSMAPGASRSASDRVQVRGKEEIASPSTAARSEDPARQPAPDRASDQGYKPYAPNYGHAVLDGKVVKVSGKILSRGGIQAIEVATIEDASTTSPTPSSSSSSDGTAIK